MLAITIPAFNPPSGYQLTEQPTPKITDQQEVLIEVHAASVNPVDVKKANGAFKFAVGEAFPYVIGYDAAGTVVEVGSDVKNFKAGNEVYVRLPEIARGSWAEYVKVPASFVAVKPPSLSFAEAASLPLAAMTALQVLQKYEGGLTGKTVFIPAGLSGTGLAAVQLAKNVFAAGKVITTVSTKKVPQVPELLGEGVVDEVIDYTKTEPLNVIPKHSVDFIFDTTGAAMQLLPLLKPKTGMVISVSTLPSGDQAQASGFMQRPGSPKIPFLAKFGLNLLDSISKLRAWRYGVYYSYLFLSPNGKDLDLLREYVETGKLKPIVGRKVDMRKIEDVREACQAVYSKGGIGKTVIEVIAGV